MTKKIINEKFFLCHNKEFKLRILTKNLVNFRKWDDE